MKVVIIGGTGLIGRKLATKLQLGGQDVVAIASIAPPDRDPMLKQDSPNVLEPTFKATPPLRLT